MIQTGEFQMIFDTQNHARPGGSAPDARTTRHPGYAVSQWMRKRIE
jgi:hypothetical protein